MSAPAIRVDGLGKRYELRHARPERYVALRDVVADRARALGRALIGRGAAAAPAAREEFWALRDVSLSIARGERVGIIGRNGAGKSTLLKLLSRVTEPTAGRIELEGRVASLLEVGTGFHPELTGRENVFLNGAILGMGRAEIRRKFDEIVAFAEIEKFLDTPVKRYSSGMYVRLAFAVAAHLEPEILLVDEVLAVGDAQFQKKCLGRMAAVGSEGRTVVFVSHNMGAVQGLCTRGYWLKEGRVAFAGPIGECVSRYAMDWTGAHGRRIDLAPLRRPSGAGLRQAALLRWIEMESGPSGESGAPGEPWQLAFPGEPVFRVGVRALRPLPALELGLALYNGAMVEVASSLSTDALRTGAVEPGDYVFTAVLRELRLTPGSYALGLGLRSEADASLEDYLPESAWFEILPSEASAALRAFTRRGAIIPNAAYAFAPDAAGSGDAAGAAGPG